MGSKLKEKCRVELKEVLEFYCECSKLLCYAFFYVSGCVSIRVCVCMCVSMYVYVEYARSTSVLYNSGIFKTTVTFWRTDIVTFVENLLAFGV